MSQKVKTNIVSIESVKSSYLACAVYFPEILQDVIDSINDMEHREIAQRILCMPPLYDLENNSECYIARRLSVTRWKVRWVREKLKKIIWEKLAKHAKSNSNN